VLITVYTRVSRSAYKLPPPQNRVRMWSKIIGPCISRRWFWGLVPDAGQHNPRRRRCRQRRHLCSVVDVVRRIRSCVFWPLEKVSLFYDAVMSCPLTFPARFRHKFCDLYTSIYGNASIQQVEYVVCFSQKTTTRLICQTILLACQQKIIRVLLHVHCLP